MKIPLSFQNSMITMMIVGILFYSNKGYSQSGEIDISFNTGAGVGEGYVSSTAIVEDGKVIIVGSFDEYDGTTRHNIARINADGTLDDSFDPGIGTDGVIYNLAIQDDGKILICGEFTTYNGVSQNRITRLLPDGGLDPYFDVGTGADAWVETITIQPDGKILIGGVFFAYNGIPNLCIARLEADGAHDPSFVSTAGITTAVHSLTLQQDGKIIVGGTYILYEDTSLNCIMRLNTDGTLDAGFDTGTGAAFGVMCTLVQPDGKILIGGHFYGYNSISSTGLMRINEDGSPDESFEVNDGISGLGWGDDAVNTMALQPDGKILIGGRFLYFDGNARNNIARVNSDGSFDASFDPGTGADFKISHIELQADGKIVVGGQFAEFNDLAHNGLVRLSNDIGAVGIVDEESDVKASVFPNPSSTQLTISCSVSNRIEIMDTDGKLIFSVKMNHSEIQKKINIETLPTGVYFIKSFMEDGAVVVNRFIKT